MSLIRMKGPKKETFYRCFEISYFYANRWIKVQVFMKVERN